MKDKASMDIAAQAMDIIKKGAFLTVKAGNDINVMTIGWATIGYIWRKEVLMVMVRKSRHTFGLIEKADDFTVTVPTSDYKKAVMFCGTKSGRDFDKFKECNLVTAKAKSVNSPVMDIPGYHFECRTVYKTAMTPEFLDPAIHTGLYADEDYHTLYFGEIVACYQTE